MLFASRAAAYPVRTADVVRRVVDTLIAAVPTGIPTIICFSLVRCVAALKRVDVNVHSVAAVKTAAAVEAVIFDKTGTLTGNLVRVHMIAHIMCWSECCHRAAAESYCFVVCMNFSQQSLDICEPANVK